MNGTALAWYQVPPILKRWSKADIAGLKRRGAPVFCAIVRASKTSRRVAVSNGSGHYSQIGS
jgi:hypothetical protein